jgi:hypothetical protein
MGENPLISDGKRHPSSLMEIGDKVLENFDARVKNSRLIAHYIFCCKPRGFPSFEKVYIRI